MTHYADLEPSKSALLFYGVNNMNKNGKRTAREWKQKRQENGREQKKNGSIIKKI